MLKILLKKQLYELNSSFFYDRKKGKARAKSTSILFIVLYALLILVLIIKPSGLMGKVVEDKA